MNTPEHDNDNGDASALHQALVDKLQSEGHICTPRVEAAFRAISRHLFLPGVSPNRVYSDEAIATKVSDGQAISSSSQPAMMAIMLEQLGLEPGHHVLEIGAGTGYNAALTAHIVGDAGQVVTVDVDEDIVEGARAHLAAAGFDQVQVVCGDGGFGYAGAAPYDRIVLTVGAWDIAPAWREQLKPDGRLLLPLSIRGNVQVSVAFESTDDHLVSVSVKPCGFMRLRGAFASPDGSVQLGPDPGLHLSVDDRNQVDAAAAYQLLSGPSQDWPTTVQLTPGEVWGGLNLWLALREPGFCWLSAEGEWVERGVVPYLFGHSGTFCSAVGLIGEAGLCVLMRPPDQSPPVEQPDEPQPFELFARSFGPDEALAHRLLDQVAGWDAAGRPSIEGLRLRSYLPDSDYVSSASELAIQKQWSRLVLDWR